MTAVLMKRENLSAETDMLIKTVKRYRKNDM